MVNITNNAKQDPAPAHGSKEQHVDSKGEKDLLLAEVTRRDGEMGKLNLSQKGTAPQLIRSGDNCAALATIGFPYSR